MSRRKNEENKAEMPYLIGAVISLIFVIIVKWIWPKSIPFDILYFWQPKGTFWKAVLGAWPWYLWGAATTIFICVRTRNDPEVNQNAESVIVGGTVISIIAGVFEEIAFRWCFFYAAIIGVVVVDWLFLGFMGLHWVKWLYVYVFCPLANFTSFGCLKPVLAAGFSWAVPAAVISANSKFRDGHKYQGLIGLVNSWFLGLYLFWVMFTYGLPAAIVVHFLYDQIIFTLVYFDAAVERKLGWT
jgi:hypothetical protein